MSTKDSRLEPEQIAVLYTSSLKDIFEFLKYPSTVVLLGVSILILSSLIWTTAVKLCNAKRRSSEKRHFDAFRDSARNSPTKPHSNNFDTVKDEAARIEPLRGFNWTQKEPISYPPFKPLYHLTMGIEKGDVTDLVQIDKHYLEKIRERKEIMAMHSDHVIGADERSTLAVREFYAWLLGTLLPQRYGELFELKSSHSQFGLETTVLHNKLTDEHVPVEPPPDRPEDALRIIGRMVEEDFLFLMPSGPEGALVLHAFVACFPAGFDWAKKKGQTLASIHDPVPDYKKKLQSSMDRFLGRVVPGTFVKRVNWSLSPEGKLFALANLHNYSESNCAEMDLDFTKACLRSERQMIHRLPVSRALVFSIHTYLYPLRSIKADGHGPELAQAIDGLRDGSSPRIHVYKNAVSWGESAKRYLLDSSGENNGD